MFDEFDGLDATETAGIGAALNRCRARAAKIGNGLRNKRPEHFLDKLTLADIHEGVFRRQPCNDLLYERTTVFERRLSLDLLDHDCTPQQRFP